MKPPTMTLPQTYAALNLGKTKVNELLNSNQLVRVRFGRRVLVLTESVEQLIAAAITRNAS